MKKFVYTILSIIIIGVIIMFNIYKDNWTGNPRSELILDNQIEGIFGEEHTVIDSERETPTIPNIIKRESIIDEYEYNYHYISSRSPFPLPPPPSSGNIQSGAAHTTYIINKTFSFNYNFKTPIKNVEVNANLVSDMYSYSYHSTTAPVDVINLVSDVSNWIHNRQIDETTIQDLGTELIRPHTTIAAENLIIKTENRAPLVISNLQTSDFNITFDVIANITLNGELSTNRVFNVSSTGLIQNILVDIDYLLFNPNFIEVIVRADTTDIIITTFSVGNKENSLEIRPNTLITTKANINNVSLIEFIYNRIVNDDKWIEGKQTIGLTTIVKNDISIKKVEDIIRIINARSKDIDEDNINDINYHSIAKNQDGTAKIFEITSAEFIFDGGFKQKLDVVEVTRDIDAIK